MKKQITIDGVPGTWTPNKDDDWEYVGQITKFEPGYEYQLKYSYSSSWQASTEIGNPAEDCEYRRRPREVWQGAGFYEMTEDDEPVGFILHPHDEEFPYVSQEDRYRKGSLVRLVRTFTAAEIISIVNEGIWPEKV